MITFLEHDLKIEIYLRWILKRTNTNVTWTPTRTDIWPPKEFDVDVTKDFKNKIAKSPSVWVY